MAEYSRRDKANRQQKLGLVWRNRKKISQIIKDYFYLPFFLLIILCLQSSSQPFRLAEIISALLKKSTFHNESKNVSLAELLKENKGETLDSLLNFLKAKDLYLCSYSSVKMDVLKSSWPGSMTLLYLACHKKLPGVTVSRFAYSPAI